MNRVRVGDKDHSIMTDMKTFNVLNHSLLFTRVDFFSFELHLFL